MKPKSTGSKRAESEDSTGKLRNAPISPARKYPRVVLCIRNQGNAASLERGKAYRVIRPLPTDPPHRIRVIDEENEDYLYPTDWFVPIEVPAASRKSVLQAVSA